MEKEAQKFLEAEEKAHQLVDTLNKLLEEAGSYKTAREELDNVRQRLTNLIDSIEKVAKDSYEIVILLKEIGGPEILGGILELKNLIIEGFVMQSENLKEVENKMNQEFDKQSKNLKEAENKMNQGFDKQSKNLEEVENKINQGFDKQSENLKSLRIFIILTFTSSLIAIIVGIIALLK